ncbi:MAG: ATP-binding protein [Oscillospiraceae bacterium]
MKVSQTISFHYDVPGDDFTRAGEASSSIKKALKQVGLAPDIIRNVAIAMYEGEINMVIHAGGGQIDVDIAPDAVRMVLKDQGPGIQDISLAMQAGWSTAPDDVRSLGFGAGMGLPNMKKYTDEMKIESTVGVGTTVSMTVFTHPQEEAVS